MTAQFFEKYGYFDTDYVLLNMPGDDEKLWDFFERRGKHRCRQYQYG